MMRRWTRSHIMTAAAAAAAVILLGYFLTRRAVDDRSHGLLPIVFSEIEGWDRDDHRSAFAAFRRSCDRILAVEQARSESGKDTGRPHRLSAVCRAAVDQEQEIGKQAARAFFETRFTPHRYAGVPYSGFVTGYYEPELEGSRTRSDHFTIPVYRVPEDLVQLFPDEERARRNNEMTAGGRENGTVVPYHDRKEIEQGALDGRGLEILWLADPVDAFYMHIQGSGLVSLAEGGQVRLAYAAKNGHAYTAIGSILIARGEIARERMSMEVVRGWLAKNPNKARELMWQNRSYIFFRELPREGAAAGPVGAQGVMLTPRRSLAVDTSIHVAGTPIWVDAPELSLHGGSGFCHLMVAQDTGSAIRGPERGDIFWGSGVEAGTLAGSTRHRASFTVFLPNALKP